MEVRRMCWVESEFRQIVEKFKKWLEYFIGGYDSILYMLIILVVIVVFTGILVSIMRKQFSLKRELNIIFSKLLMLIIIGIVNLFDMNIVIMGCTLRSMVILYYIVQEANEIFSILDIIGVCIPSVAKRILKILNQNTEND